MLPCKLAATYLNHPREKVHSVWIRQVFQKISLHFVYICARISPLRGSYVVFCILGGKYRVQHRGRSVKYLWLVSMPKWYQTPNSTTTTKKTYLPSYVLGKNTTGPFCIHLWTVANLCWYGDHAEGRRILHIYGINNLCISYASILITTYS